MKEGRGAEDGLNSGEWVSLSHPFYRAVHKGTNTGGSHACLIRLDPQDFSRDVCPAAKFSASSEPGHYQVITVSQTLWHGLVIPATGEAEPERLQVREPSKR